MSDSLFFRVPAEVFAELQQEDFEEVDNFRGPQDWLETVPPMITILGGGLAAGSDVVSILAARRSLSQLADGLRRWATRQAPPGKRSLISVEVLIERPEGSSRLQIEAEGVDAAADVRQLTAQLERIFDTHAD